MIDITKKYKTKDGEEVRIYSVNGGGKYPVHGSVKQESGCWALSCWTDTGSKVKGMTLLSDLVEVKPTYWVNVFSGSTYGPFASREDADGDCGYSPYRIACLEFKEGEGL